MSATIDVNNSKFVIFGAGHDYTLADSGEGEKIFFSNPFVPLNGKNYAGQYYFLAPIYDDNDETAEPVMTDVVKDDIAHCTFTPALGTAFTTAGETTVKVHYRREYIYDESTILVEKELEQKITVVDHGAVTATSTYYDEYSDGYGYIHPNGNPVSSNIGTYVCPNSSKVSSLYWRIDTLSYLFNGCTALKDLTELQYADTSKVLNMVNMFEGCTSLESLEGLETWDVSKVVSMNSLFGGCYALKDIKALKNWNTANVMVMTKLFYQCQALPSLEGLEGWDVSMVSYLESAFDGLGVANNDYSDISSLSRWNTKRVQNISHLFDNAKIDSIDALRNWNVSNARNMSYLFYQCYYVSDYSPLSNWDTGKVTDMSYMFSGSRIISHTMLGGKMHNADFASNWNVSKVQNFNRMFQGQYWLSDISGLANWNTSVGRTFEYMFNGCHLDDISDLADWDMSRATSVYAMCMGANSIKYSPTLDKDCYFDGYDAYDINGNYAHLTAGQYAQVLSHRFNAGGATDWDINIASPTNCFDSTTSGKTYPDGTVQHLTYNIPAWN